MISPVSFGSTYKVKSTDLGQVANLHKHFQMQEFCEANDIPKTTKEIWGKQKTPISMPTYSVETTMVAPNNKDEQLETYFKLMGINYKKHSTEELLSAKAINNRIENPPKGYQKVKISPDKLFGLLEQQKDSNIDYCKSVYENYYKSRTEFMLKSGDNIPVTTLYLTPLSGKNDFLEYINAFGADNLNPDSVKIDFSQRTNDPDHCMFFSMINAGLTEIPVYVNKDTYEIGKALHLFVD